MTKIFRRMNFTRASALVAALVSMGSATITHAQGISQIESSRGRQAEPGQGFSVGVGVTRLSDVADETHDRYGSFEEDTNLSSIRLAFQLPASANLNVNFGAAVGKFTQPYYKETYDNITLIVPDASLAWEMNEMMSLYGGLNLLIFQEASELVNVRPNLGGQLGLRAQLQKFHVALAWQVLRGVYEYEDEDEESAFRFSGFNLSTGFTF